MGTALPANAPTKAPLTFSSLPAGVFSSDQPVGRMPRNPFVVCKIGGGGEIGRWISSILERQVVSRM